MERDTINLIAGGIAAGPAWVLGTLALLKVRFHAGLHAAPWRKPGPPVRARGVATPTPTSAPAGQVPPKPPQQPRPAPHPTTTGTVPPWFAADTAVQMPAVRTTTNQRGSLR